MLSDDMVTDSEPQALQVLQGEADEAIRTMKSGKSPGVDNIPAELFKYSGEEAGRGCSHHRYLHSGVLSHLSC